MKRDIKIKRTERVLKELIPEAIASLESEILHGISVVDVVCSRGRSDAKVYLDPTFIDKSEQKEIIRELKTIRKYIETYCANEQGWFKSPKLSFYFDDSLEKENRIEKLFQQVTKELHG